MVVARAAVARVVVAVRVVAGTGVEVGRVMVARVVAVEEAVGLLAAEARAQTSPLSSPDHRHIFPDSSDRR